MTTVYKTQTDKFSFQATLSPDRLKLFIDVIPISEQMVSPGELYAALQEFIDPDTLDSAVMKDVIEHLGRHEKIEHRRVRKGREPVKGNDGKLLLLLKPYTGKGEMMPNASGVVNYHELSLFDNIEPEMVVARIYPPSEGFEGIDAIGEPIKSEHGKPAEVRWNNTLECVAVEDERYDKLVAKTSGYLLHKDKTLSIEPELRIRGDLNYQYGNLDFIGEIYIAGSILPGFTAKSRENITIEGNLQQGTIHCACGDVLIKSSVIGGGSSEIICGGSVEARTVQEGRIEAHGDITIKKQALNSTLRSGSAIYAPSGQIVGGKSFVVCGLEAKEIGNEKGILTVITLCSDIEATDEFGKLKMLIKSHDDAARMLKLHLGPLAKNPERIKLLNQSHQKKMEKLLKKLQGIEAGRIRLLDRQKRMLENAQISSQVRVNYLSKLYSGVVLYAGDCVHEIKDTLDGPASIEFDRDAQEFRISEYKPIECLIVKGYEEEHE